MSLSLVEHQCELKSFKLKPQICLDYMNNGDFVCPVIMLTAMTCEKRIGVLQVPWKIGISKKHSKCSN